MGINLTDRKIDICLASGRRGLVSGFNLLIFKQLLTLQVKSNVLVLQHFCIVLLCFVFNQLYKYFLLNDRTFLSEIILQRKYCLAVLVSLLPRFAVICSNCVVKCEPPSVVTNISATEIIYSFILQNLFTSEKSNERVLLGNPLAVTSVLLVDVHKFFQERKRKKKKILHSRDVHSDEDQFVCDDSINWAKKTEREIKNEIIIWFSLLHWSSVSLIDLKVFL